MEYSTILLAVAALAWIDGASPVNIRQLLVGLEADNAPVRIFALVAARAVAVPVVGVAVYWLGSRVERFALLDSVLSLLVAVLLLGLARSVWRNPVMFVPVVLLSSGGIARQFARYTLACGAALLLTIPFYIAVELLRTADASGGLLLPCTLVYIGGMHWPLLWMLPARLYAGNAQALQRRLQFWLNRGLRYYAAPLCFVTGLAMLLEWLETLFAGIPN